MSLAPDSIEPDVKINGRAVAAPAHLPPVPEKSQRFHEQCVQQQMKVLEGSVSYDDLLECTLLMLLQERLDLHDKTNDLLAELVDAGDRFDVYRTLSDVAYKREKMIVEMSNTRLRANELKDQEAAPRGRRQRAKPPTKEAGRQQSRKPR